MSFAVVRRTSTLLAPALALGLATPSAAIPPAARGPEPTHAAAVREAVLRWRFEPALIRGIPVAQLVERAVRFTR